MTPDTDASPDTDTSPDPDIIVPVLNLPRPQPHVLAAGGSVTPEAVITTGPGVLATGVSTGRAGEIVHIAGPALPGLAVQSYSVP